MNIDKLREKKMQLDNRIKAYEARQKDVARKARTRRLVIWGTVIEKALSDGQIDDQRWRRWCEHYVSTRDRQIALNYDVNRD